MEMLYLANNRGIANCEITRKRYLVKVVTDHNEIMIHPSYDRLEALGFAFDVAIRKPWYKVYFVRCRTI